jgi:regulator of nucleoside diphosphate kinase
MHGDEMPAKPKIVLSSIDAARLTSLLESLPDDEFPVRDELEAEIAHADIVEPQDVPPNVVTMNSTVQFRMKDSDKSFFLTLVYPKASEPNGGTVSVLAPVGRALLGLTQGDEIDWPRPDGGMMRLRIENILYQPERAGDFLR